MGVKPSKVATKLDGLGKTVNNIKGIKTNTLKLKNLTQIKDIDTFKKVTNLGTELNNFKELQNAFKNCTLFCNKKN